MNVYEIVTERIVKKLEQGVIPWRQPWKGGKGPVNWVSEKPYRGINTLLLEPGEYATAKQIKEAGGVITDRSPKIVVFYTEQIKENDKGEAEKFPVLRYYKVFEINTQVSGLTSKRFDTTEEEAPDPIETAEALVHGFANAPEIQFKGGAAYYHRVKDLVSVPPLADYQKAEEFYSVLFHELVHATGSKNRLNRQKGKSFGDEAYSKEELIAEIGAAMLCGVAGFEQITIDNSAAYIGGWLKALKDDKRLIVTAAAAAQRAADYIQNKPQATIQAS